jgi:hypothetical protein
MLRLPREVRRDALLTTRAKLGRLLVANGGPVPPALENPETVRFPAPPERRTPNAAERER